MHTGAHAINRGIVVAETNLVEVRTKAQLLHHTVLGMDYGDAQGLGYDAQCVLAPGNLLLYSIGAELQNLSRRAARNDAAIVVIVIQSFAGCCDGDPDRGCGDRRDGDVHSDLSVSNRNPSAVFSDRSKRLRRGEALPQQDSR